MTPKELRELLIKYDEKIGFEPLALVNENMFELKQMYLSGENVDNLGLPEGNVYLYVNKRALSGESAYDLYILEVLKIYAKFVLVKIYSLHPDNFDLYGYNTSLSKTDLLGTSGDFTTMEKNKKQVLEKTINNNMVVCKMPDLDILINL